MNRSYMIAVAVVLAAACSEHTAPTPGGTSVSVQDNQFNPQQANVGVGATVTWTWAGSNQHNVTFSDGPASSTQVTGTYQRQFAAAGNYSYLCTVHGAFMSGTVVVQ